MKKPIIGVLPLWDNQKSSIWMLPGYVDALRLSGAIPTILPLEIEDEDLKQLCNHCDGFLLTGGHDVSPSLYNEPKSPHCGDANPLRDSLETRVFNYATERNMPILGICRGIQIINALCGGTLYQDLPSEYDPSCREIHQMSPPYDQPCHRVSVVDGSPLHLLTKAKILDVNSYHHQAIKTLAPDLATMATSEDGLIEAVYMPSKRFVWAVQWHPEFNFHTSQSSRAIVGAFVEACKI
ncbi:MAG: gamma-glutamyl-gamma-aminobutyrate hydrolase family protein [Rikenellaceae bacterium]